MNKPKPKFKGSYSAHLTRIQNEVKERRKDMDNERDSGSNPRTHGPRERKEADKANGMDREFSCIKMLKHRTK